MMDAILQPFLAVLLVAVLSGLFGLVLTNIGRKAKRVQDLPIYGLIGGAALWYFRLINKSRWIR